VRPSADEKESVLALSSVNPGQWNASFVWAISFVLRNSEFSVAGNATFPKCIGRGCLCRACAFLKLNLSGLYGDGCLGRCQTKHLLNRGKGTRTAELHN
jgi:hypothetical protein